MANNIPIIEKIKGTIESVKLIKTGQAEKEGRIFEWKLYEVMISGKIFRTFDPGYLKLMNQTGEWSYKKEMRQGRNGVYESRTLDNLPKPKTGSVELIQILENTKKILKILESKSGVDEAEGLEEEEEINVEDIPF